MTLTLFSFCYIVPIMCWLEMSRWRGTKRPKTNNGVPVYTQQRPLLQWKPKNGRPIKTPKQLTRTKNYKNVTISFDLRALSLSLGRQAGHSREKLAVCLGCVPPEGAFMQIILGKNIESD